ncbi:c-type cytochrome biogenesis protein CcsB [Blastococcus sp. TF02-8]|uniref:c-type cytochrome biogenesis protein CcsB n=1 Tax=Blastococcus sp. TF02-8 TaxID=2250574 RepID=UPI00197A8004|nr:c-type cytochrome biogenesis protein CcsB [Blastococcus sp. TF02-8]
MSSAALSSLSDALFSVGIAVYSLALVGFCAELAFNHGHQSPALVGTEGSVDRWGVAGSPEGDASAPRGVERASGRAALLGRVGVALTVLAAVAQAGVLVTRGMATGRLPWGNVYEFGTAVVLVAVLAFLVTVHRVPEARRLGIFVVGPAALALVLIGLFLYTQAGPLVAALRSAWLAVHVTAAVVGFGTFMVSGIANVLYLVRLRRDSARGSDSCGEGGRSSRLPSAATLDVVGHRTAVFGFPIWTFAVIAGAIWAESAWGRFWGWDPKETWAFIAWVIYAAYLHARSTAGWRGRPAAWINVLGLAAMVFNLLYVNYVSTGLHSYAG